AGYQPRGELAAGDHQWVVHVHPPCTAVRTSMPVSGLSVVVGQLVRGTTVPSTATATPRSGTPYSSSTCCSVVFSVISRLVPLMTTCTATSPAAGICGFHLLGQLFSAQQPEDGVHCDWSEQEAVAVVPGGHQHTGFQPADGREVVLGARPQPGAGFDQVVLRDPGEHLLGAGDQVSDAAHRHLGVEPRFVLGGTHHETVVPGNQVDLAAV